MPDVDLDALIEESAVYGELSAGARAEWLATRADARMVAVLASQVEPETGTIMSWTAAERRFVAENFGWMSDEELGRAIGRTAEAVHIYRERHLKLPARTRIPEWPTMHEVGRLLGLPCAKTVARWIDEGLLPARVLPLGGRYVAIERRALVRFVVNPENWIYFQPQRVVDPYLRRLLQLRRQRWHDEWWTPGQAAAYHGCSTGAINLAIHKGRLPAKRWGNWWIKRSDAVALKILPGKGHREEIAWSSAGDAFLVLARALGFSLPTIERMCGWPENRAHFRLTTLCRLGAISRLIQKHNLAVQYDPETHRLYADWRDYRRRFKRLAAAMDRFLAGTALERDADLIACTLATWSQWHAQTDEQRDLARCIRHASTRTLGTVRRQYAELQKWGIEDRKPPDTNIQGSILVCRLNMPLIS